MFGDFVITRRFMNPADWLEGFLASRHVARTWYTYTYNKDNRVNVAELTQSYELHLIDHGFDFVEGVELSDEERERIDSEMRDALDAASEDVIYIHCRNLDRLPLVLTDGTVVKYEHGGVDEEDEEDSVEWLREFYRGNPLW